MEKQIAHHYYDISFICYHWWIYPVWLNFSNDETQGLPNNVPINWILLSKSIYRDTHYYYIQITTISFKYVVIPYLLLHYC